VTVEVHTATTMTITALWNATLSDLVHRYQLRVNDQLDTFTLYKTFIILIPYMFRATLCSLSGGQIVLIQHLV